MAVTKQKIVFFLLFLQTVVAIQAQQADAFPDSTTYLLSPFLQSIDKITSSKAYKMTFIGVPLVTGGLIVKGSDHYFRGLRNEYLERFRKHYDDYTQYVPAAIMLGMKFGGAKGRSSWKRMLVSDAFSIGLMAATVNCIKQTAQVRRPDDSNNHSFPSGHTATAFMTATMMHKEYGEISPWYSIGAYSIAAGTGISRIINNKHWLSDVLAGAGFGILSTELGYFLADLIFKEKGLNTFPLSDMPDRFRHPSFLGIYLGMNIPLGQFTLNDNSRLRLSTGGESGIEGAYFFNPYVGLGGRLSAANLSIAVEDRSPYYSINTLGIYGGGYLSYPLTSRIRVEGKTLAGYNYVALNELQLPLRKTEPQVGNSIAFCFGIGSALLIKRNLETRFFIDYNLSTTGSQLSNRHISSLSTGCSAAVAF